MLKLFPFLISFTDKRKIFGSRYTKVRNLPNDLFDRQKFERVIRR